MKMKKKSKGKGQGSGKATGKPAKPAARKPLPVRGKSGPPKGGAPARKTASGAPVGAARDGLGPLLPVEPRPEDPRAKATALAAVEAALEKKCVEPVMLDVRALASYTDYILIVSGRSDRQVGAIADGIIDELAKHGRRPMGSEGLRDGQWSLIDFGDLIVHVFYHPVREFYDLEGLWSDAPRVPLVVPPEARAQYHDSYAT